MRHVRTTIVVEEKQKVLHNLNVYSICRLTYLVCNAHAPYCHLWNFRLYNIFFPHYLTNCTIFEKNSCNRKCLFRLSLQSFSETFDYSKNS